MRRSRLALALVVGAACTSIAPLATALPPTELMGEGTVIPLKHAAMITKTKVGYRYQAGQQDSHLVVRSVGRRLVFVDTGTADLRRRPASCHERSVRRGIAVSCWVGAHVTRRHPVFVEVWPRLGDDLIDGSRLPVSFRLWTLADAGRDTVLGGAGADFVNGAQNRDHVSGGAGRDWLRTGRGPDVIRGGRGNDRLVGVDGRDRIHGGRGNDRVGGGPGNDRLFADSGRDKVACGSGHDNAILERIDRAADCESVRRT